MAERYISTSPMVCIMIVRQHCRSGARWRIKIQEMMLGGTLGYPLAVQSLVFTLRERVGTRLAPIAVTMEHA